MAASDFGVGEVDLCVDVLVVVELSLVEEELGEALTETLELDGLEDAS